MFPGTVRGPERIRVFAITRTGTVRAVYKRFHRIRIFQGVKRRGPAVDRVDRPLACARDMHPRRGPGSRPCKTAAGLVVHLSRSRVYQGGSPTRASQHSNACRLAKPAGSRRSCMRVTPLVQLRRALGAAMPRSTQSTHPPGIGRHRKGLCEEMRTAPAHERKRGWDLAQGAYRKGATCAADAGLSWRAKSRRAWRRNLTWPAPRIMGATA